MFWAKRNVSADTIRRYRNDLKRGVIPPYAELDEVVTRPKFKQFGQLPPELQLTVWDMVGHESQNTIGFRFGREDRLVGRHHSCLWVGNIVNHYTSVAYVKPLVSSSGNLASLSL